MRRTGIVKLAAGLGSAVIAMAVVSAAAPATAAPARPLTVAAPSAPVPADAVPGAQQSPAAPAPAPQAPAPAAPPAAGHDDTGDPLAIDVEAGPGIWAKPTGEWESRTSFSFVVTVTDSGSGNDEDLSVFVSVPDQTKIRQTSGDRWTCQDVDGGVRCTNPDLVVPGEAWPALTVQGWVLSDNHDDSLDVYATGTAGKEVHWSVPWTLDTSV